MITEKQMHWIKRIKCRHREYLEHLKIIIKIFRILLVQIIEYCVLNVKVFYY